MHNSFKLIFKPLSLIGGVFFISFLSFLAILTWDNKDYIAIFLTYLMSFGFAFVANIMVLKNFINTLHNNEEHIKLLSDIAKLDGEVICLIDKNLNCFNYNTSNYFKYSSINKKLRFFLSELDISSGEIMQIEDFIRGYEKEINSQRLFKQIDTLYLLNIRYQQIQCDLIIKPLNIKNQLYCIKTRQNITASSYSIYEQLPIGYFELDNAGFISKANIWFSANLGYQLSDFLEGSIKLTDLIINENKDNSDTDSGETLNYVQKFVTIKTKQNNFENFLLIINSHDEDHSSPKTYGFLVKLGQKEVNYFTKHLEKYWIDYSWKCFFNDSPYPVCLVNLNGSTIKVNKSFINQVVKKKPNYNFANLFNEMDAKLVEEKLSILIQGHSEPQTHIDKLCLKNSSKIFEVFIASIYNLDGKLDSFLIRITDITQRKNLEDHFSHAQRMQTIGQLVGSVAHDFNNILTAISGFCDLLLLRHGMGDPSFSNIMQIKQSADRASNLVKRLLAFSRKQTLQLQIANLIDLFSDFTPLIQRLIGTYIKFSQAIDPNIWPIKVDVVQIEQVLLNLVVNAQQAMGNHGTLNIRAENFIFDNQTKLHGYIAPLGEKKPPFGEYVELSVEDTGCGISKENLRKIFEPFYTTKPPLTGTGLGLSTVYGVIRQSNAYIFVKSKINKGTKFIIFFPRANLVDSSPTQEIIKPNEVIVKDYLNSNVSGFGTIIIVEDEEAIRIFTKKVLTNKGYTVVDFSSAADALQKIVTDKINFDLLLTDVLMPEMSGTTLVSKLQETIPHIKVIFISGYAEEAFTAEYGDKRDFNFLAKPFSLKQLLVKVREVIGS